MNSAGASAPSWWQTAFITAAALIAFAANSVLCRMALEEPLIDPGLFTAVRLASGGAVLALLVLVRGRNPAGARNWVAPVTLFVYAAAFSYAYLRLETGTGALILFGSVQLTMVAAALIRGHRLVAAEWGGLVLALAGFTALALPGAAAPPALGFLLMAAAGISWGFYTLNGRGSRRPLQDTAGAFLYSLPLAGLLLLFAWPEGEVSPRGILLAAASGAVASGCGYAIWYAALRHLTITKAGVVQLFVPALAALAGVVFLGEALTARFALSASLILFGILLVIRRRGPS